MTIAAQTLHPEGIPARLVELYLVRHTTYLAEYVHVWYIQLSFNAGEENTHLISLTLGQRNDKQGSLILLSLTILLMWLFSWTCSAAESGDPEMKFFLEFSDQSGPFSLSLPVFLKLENPVCQVTPLWAYHEWTALMSVTTEYSMSEGTYSSIDACKCVYVYILSPMTAMELFTCSDWRMVQQGNSQWWPSSFADSADTSISALSHDLSQPIYVCTLHMMQWWHHPN